MVPVSAALYTPAIVLIVFLSMFCLSLFLFLFSFFFFFATFLHFQLSGPFLTILFISFVFDFNELFLYKQFCYLANALLIPVKHTSMPN